jgi:aryl-alcohol dehydrogenase-like predicted oxidoreductase
MAAELSIRLQLTAMRKLSSAMKWRRLGDSRVTAVIPGTGDRKHMLDNLGAMRGRLPDAAERAKMVSFVEAL